MDMRIGILSAMYEEAYSVLKLLTDVSEHRYGRRTYYLGKFRGVEVVLSFSGWGKVASASTATTMINTFNIDQLIFIGVAGSVSSELKVGDMIVSDTLYQRDVDARPVFKRYEIPLTGITFFKTDALLSKYAKNACQTLIDQFQRAIPKQLSDQFDIEQPKFKVGKISSGDQFVSGMEQVSEIHSSVHGVLGVEMEGAAVAQVATDYDLPFTVVRVISDRSDCSAKADLQAFIEQIATKYSEFLIKEMLTQIESSLSALCR